ncbi:MAG: DMT family transporter, partial [Thermoprotei archaeon]
TTVSTSVASTLVYTQPVMVVALSPLVGERLSAIRTAGIVSAFLGVVVVFYPTYSHSSLTMGDLLEIGSAGSWATAVLLFKKWGKAYNSYLVTALQSLFGALFIAPFSYFYGVRFEPALPFWFYLSYNVLLATALAYTLYFHVLTRMSASTFTSYLFLVPILTTLFASIIDLSLPQWYEVVGTLMVSAGIIFANYSRGQHRADS